MKKTFTSRYDSLRNEEEFVKFTEIFDKVLKRRGIERKKYTRDLEDFFCHVRISDQLRAKDQLKELFGRIRDLKKDNHELYEHIDSLRSELQELEKVNVFTEAESNEVSTRKGRCNQETKPSVLL